jgi:hypothetical protein
MKRPFDEERLAVLAAPKPLATLKPGTQDDKKKDAQDPTKKGEDKAKEMIDKV